MLLKSCIVMTMSILFLSNCEARKMWGSRKKHEEDEETAAAAAAATFQDTIKKADIMQDGVASLSRSKKGLKVNSEVVTLISNFMETYVTMMEKLLDSPDFNKMFTPETFSVLLTQFPQLADNPQVVELLSSPSFKDPQVFKQIMSEGFKNIQPYVDQVLDLLKNPEQLEAALSQLPAEYQVVFRSLAEGDLSAIKNLISSLPGINEGQQQMLMNLLDGNKEGVQESIEQLFNDPDQIEVARQQFLADPSMAEMLGISEEILNNKSKFAEYMKNSLKALGQGGAGLGETDFADFDLGESLSGFTA